LNRALGHHGADVLEGLSSTTAEPGRALAYACVANMDQPQMPVKFVGAEGSVGLERPWPLPVLSMYARTGTPALGGSPNSFETFFAFPAADVPVPDFTFSMYSFAGKETEGISWSEARDKLLASRLPWHNMTNEVAWASNLGHGPFRGHFFQGLRRAEGAWKGPLPGEAGGVGLAIPDPWNLKVKFSMGFDRMCKAK